MSSFRNDFSAHACAYIVRTVPLHVRDVADGHERGRRRGGWGECGARPRSLGEQGRIRNRS